MSQIPDRRPSADGADGGARAGAGSAGVLAHVAGSLPPEARVVALVHQADEADRGAALIAAVAAVTGRRRGPTLLIGARRGPSALDVLLGATGPAGLAAVLDGRARLSEVTVQRKGRPYAYLPAGHDSAAARLLDGDAPLAFLSSARGRGATVLLAVTERTRLSPQLRRLLDGCLVFGDPAPGDYRALASYGTVPLPVRRPPEAPPSPAAAPTPSAETAAAPPVTARPTAEKPATAQPRGGPGTALAEPPSKADAAVTARPAATDASDTEAGPSPLRLAVAATLVIGLSVGSWSVLARVAPSLVGEVPRAGGTLPAEAAAPTSARAAGGTGAQPEADDGAAAPAAGEAEPTAGSPAEAGEPPGEAVEAVSGARYQRSSPGASDGRPGSPARSDGRPGSPVRSDGQPGGAVRSDRRSGGPVRSVERP